MSITDAVKQQTCRVFMMPVHVRFAAIVDVITIWQRRARDRQTLRRLDDHSLRDIGLTRPKVVMEATKPFWRP